MRMNAKKSMYSITLISLTGLLASAVVYRFSGIRAAYTAAIAFGTTFYHLGMRLAVGLSIDAKYHNQMDHKKKWFSVGSFERTLYEKIGVKQWKKRLPTFTPQNFQLKSHSVTEVIQATCQAEIVHEINMVLSFVPVLFSRWFGSLDVFLITSCAAFLFDGTFVIIQRYNRPRLMRLLKKEKNGSH